MAGQRAKAVDGLRLGTDLSRCRSRATAGGLLGAVRHTHLRARAAPGRMRVSDRRAGGSGRAPGRLARRDVGVPNLAAVARLQVELFTTLGRAIAPSRSVSTISGASASSGRRIRRRRKSGRNTSASGARSGSRSIEDLVDLPLMTDPERCATMDVLTAVASTALVYRRESALSCHLSDGEPQPGARQQRRLVLRLCLARHDPWAVFWRVPGGVPLRQARPGPGGTARATSLRGPRLPDLRAPRYSLDPADPHRPAVGAARLRCRQQIRRPHLCGI